MLGGVVSEFCPGSSETVLSGADTEFCPGENALGDQETASYGAVSALSSVEPGHSTSSVSSSNTLAKWVTSCSFSSAAGWR